MAINQPPLTYPFVLFIFLYLLSETTPPKTYHQPNQNKIKQQTAYFRIWFHLSVTILPNTRSNFLLWTQQNLQLSSIPPNITFTFHSSTPPPKKLHSTNRPKNMGAHGRHTYVSFSKKKRCPSKPFSYDAAKSCTESGVKSPLMACLALRQRRFVKFLGMLFWRLGRRSARTETQKTTERKIWKIVFGWGKQTCFG